MTPGVSFNRIRKQSHCSRSLDGPGYHPLVFGTIAGPAGRNNLGVGVHEAAQKLRVFIIDGVDIVGAEIAGFRRGRRRVLLGVEFHGHNGILCKKLRFMLVRMEYLQVLFHPLPS